jgi:adenylate kinase family enzyme
MKSIILVGTARTGKSTLGRLIKDKYPIYNLIEGDSIYMGIYKVFKKEFNYKNYFFSQLNKDIMSNILSRFLKFDNINGPFIYVGEQIFPKELNDILPDRSKAYVYYLGHGECDKEQIFSNIRKYDNDHDWTKNMDDIELIDNVEEIIKKDNTFKEECKKYNFEYIDTSNNRRKKFDSIINQISENS